MDLLSVLVLYVLLSAGVYVTTLNVTQRLFDTFLLDSI